MRGTAAADVLPQFFVPEPTPLVTDMPPAAAVADLDADGRDDIVLATGGSTDGVVSIRLAQPQGGHAVTAMYPVLGQIERIDLLDLDGDGRKDIVLEGNFALTVLRALPAGGYAKTLERDVTGDVGITDLNGDARPDLAFAPSGESKIWVASGQPDGTFTLTAHATGSIPKSVQTFDYNGDGRLDVLAIHTNGWNSTLFLGIAGGLAPATESYSTGLTHGSPLMSDLDGDGDIDQAMLADTGTHLSVSLFAGGQYTPAGSIPLGSVADKLLAGDFNGDGRVDIATLGRRDETAHLVIVPGFGGGTFGPATSQSLGAHASDVVFAAGDLDADGRTDFLLGDADGHWGVRAWHNRTPAVTLIAPAATQSKSIDLTRLVGNVARVSVRVDGPGGRTEDLELEPHSGTTTFTGWDDGEYRFRAVAYKAGGAELGTSTAVTVFDTASTIELEQASLKPQLVGEASEPLPLLVRNRGLRPMTVTSVTLGGNPDFALVQDGCAGKTLPVGETCTALVRFTPSANGPSTTTVTVAGDSAFAPRDFTLTGAGYAASVEPLVPPAPSPSGPSAPPPASPAPVRLTMSQRASRKSTRFLSLRVENLPQRSTVVIRCRKGCSRTSLTFRNVSGALSLRTFTRRALPVGTKLTVRVTAPGTPALTLTMTVRKSKAPRVATTKLGAR